MENLEFLLEEEKNLNEKIKKGLKSLKEWFEAKIEQIKELQSNLMDKIKNKLSNIKALKVTKSRPEVGIKAGDSPSKIKNKVMTEFSNFKKLTNDIVSKCKNGIKNVFKKDIKSAKKDKEEVIKNTKKVTYVVKRIVIVLTCIGVVNVSDKAIVKILKP